MVCSRTGISTRRQRKVRPYSVPLARHRDGVQTQFSFPFLDRTFPKEITRKLVCLILYSFIHSLPFPDEIKCPNLHLDRRHQCRLPNRGRTE